MDSSPPGWWEVMGIPNDSIGSCGHGKCAAASAPTEATNETVPSLLRPMRVYQLYVRADRAWSWVCTFEAPTHAEAFRHVLACLCADELDRPIRLEEDIEGAFCKPCNRRCQCFSPP